MISHVIIMMFFSRDYKRGASLDTESVNLRGRLGARKEYHD